MRQHLFLHVMRHQVGVGARNFFKRFLSQRVAAIHVRVIFFHELAILRFDRCFITGVVEVKHGERIFVTRVNGLCFRFKRSAIAKHLVKGFFEFGGGAAFELIHPPGWPVTGCCIALKSIDFVLPHALEIVPFFVEFSDVLFAEPLIFVQMATAARGAKITLVQAPIPLAAVTSAFDGF